MAGRTLGVKYHSYAFSIWIQFDDRIDVPVHLIDPIEVALEELHGRKCAITQVPLELIDGGLFERDSLTCRHWK